MRLWGFLFVRDAGRRGNKIAGHSTDKKANAEGSLESKKGTT